MTLGRSLVVVAAAWAGSAAIVLACSGTSGTSGNGPDGGRPDGRGRPDAPDATQERRDGRPGDGRVPTDSGPPYLTELSVVSRADSGASVALVPPFSPSVHDYTVRCAAAGDDLVIGLQASPGAESIVLQPVSPGVPSASLPKQTVSLHVDPNEAMVAEAVDGLMSTEYWVRCLPPDFPTIAWMPHPEAGVPPEGYYLVGTTANAPGYAMVLDPRGVPVWYLLAPKAPYNVDTIVDGAISFKNTPSVPVDLPWEIHALAPPGITYVDAAALGEHELRALPNGNFLVFSVPVVHGADLTGYVVKYSDGGSEAFGLDASYIDCRVYEVDPTGKVVWTWTGDGHLDPVGDSVTPYAPGGMPDPYHCNSIDVDPGSGNLLLSARHTDSIFYVDKITKKILWTMGGTGVNADEAPNVKPSDPFRGQHDARLLPGWVDDCRGVHGQVSVFDDQVAPTKERGVVYDVNVRYGDGGPIDCGASPRDAGVTSSSLAWQYQGPVTSYALGSFRILADGSRVIGWGFGVGPDQITFTEVDEKGHDLLDVGTGNPSYRAIKVPLGALDLHAMRSAVHP